MALLMPFAWAWAEREDAGREITYAWAGTPDLLLRTVIYVCTRVYNALTNDSRPPVRSRGRSAIG